jgi:excisionase family DNA binding protein
MSLWCAITEVRSQVLLRIAEAAIDLGCSEDALQQLLEGKRLSVVRFGRFAYVNRTDLMSLKDSEPTTLA